MTDGDGDPVKIVLERRARPGAAPALEEWTRGLLASAQGSGALEGSSVLRRGDGEFVILLRFVRRAALNAWQTSPGVADLLRRGDDLSDDAPSAVARTGLETWFTLPGRRTPSRPPARWKMALVTWCALLPQVLLLSYVVPPSLPRLAGIAISTAVPVVALTWCIMPALTRLLERWLFPREETS